MADERRFQRCLWMGPETAIRHQRWLRSRSQGVGSRHWVSSMRGFHFLHSTCHLSRFHHSECLYTLRGHTSTIRCLKVLDGRPVAVTGARDASIRVWDIERGVSLHHLAGHSHSVRCIEIAGHYCVSGSYDCTARVSDLIRPFRHVPSSSS